MGQVDSALPVLTDSSHHQPQGPGSALGRMPCLNDQCLALDHLSRESFLESAVPIVSFCQTPRGPGSNSREQRGQGEPARLAAGLHGKGRLKGPEILEPAMRACLVTEAELSGASGVVLRLHAARPAWPVPHLRLDFMAAALALELPIFSKQARNPRDHRNIRILQTMVSGIPLSVGLRTGM